jgi:hypothetical protein
MSLALGFPYLKKRGWIDANEFGTQPRGSFTRKANRPRALVAVAVEFAAIAINVAVFATEFAALVACRGVVAVVEIAAEFAAIMGDLGFVAADITAVAIPGKSRRHAYPY